MSFLKTKPVLLFLILWLHISLLDLFFVKYSGPVFYWAENLRGETILVHISLALVSVLFYLLIGLMRNKFQVKKIKITDKFWLVSSTFMVILIGFFIL